MSNIQAIALVGFDGPLARVLTERAARAEAAERAAWKRLSQESSEYTSYHGNDPLNRLGYGAATLVADASVILGITDAYPSLMALTTETTDISDDLVEDARKAYEGLPGSVSSVLQDLKHLSMIDMLEAAARLQQRELIPDASHFAAVLSMLVHVCSSSPTMAGPEEVDPDADFDSIWAELRDSILETEEDYD